jgi:hypothetical protein
MVRRWIWVTLLGLILFIAAGALALTLRKSPVASDIPQVKIERLKFMLTVPCNPEEYSDLEVLFMPTAEYTAEAWRHKVAGTVKVFGYLMDNGKFDVEKVVSPLPQGLSREAVKATRRLTFKPETQCGRPLVEPGEIHYDFPSGQGRLIRF